MTIATLAVAVLAGCAETDSEACDALASLTSAVVERVIATMDANATTPEEEALTGPTWAEVMPLDTAPGFYSRLYDTKVWSAWNTPYHRGIVRGAQIVGDDYMDAVRDELARRQCPGSAPPTG